MPHSLLHSFVDLPPSLVDALSDHILITPNERLAREYRRGYELHQLAEQSAWPAPEIMSLDQFLLSSHNHLCEVNPETPSLLREAELIQFAYAALEDLTVAQPTVANLLSNWKTMMQYGIPLQSHYRSDFFPRWWRAFTQLIDHSRKVPAIDAPRILSARSFVPHKPLLTVGLEELTLPQSEYLTFLCSSNQLRHVNAQGAPQTAQAVSDCIHKSVSNTVVFDNVIGAQSLTEELTHAANWAKQTKQKNGDATIGIVVPNLQNIHSAVATTVGMVLDPRRGSQSPTFDISGGPTLASHPIWQHARKLLQATVARTDYATVHSLWRSPFFCFEQKLGTIDRWPRGLQRIFHLDELLRTIKSPDAQTMSELCRTLTNTPKLKQTLDTINTLLGASGWPNLGDTTSTQYQAHQQIVLVLQRFAHTAENSNQSGDLRTTINMLDHLMSEQVFSPQRAPADIQVLGSLETTGLSFSHLWVCGLDAINFPGNAVGRSYINSGLAQRYAVPRASIQAEADFCRRQLANWDAQATHLKVSFLAKDGDSEIAPSNLLGTREFESPYLPKLRWQPRNIPLEHYANDMAPAVVKPPERTGVGLLQSHVECAFKSFAIYRLNLHRDETPALLVDHLGRGNLIHNVLFYLIKRFPSQASLATVTESDLTDAVIQSLNELKVKLPTAFVIREQARLTQLAQAWLELEQHRAAFNVVAVEESHVLDIAGLKFNLRIDRHDEIDGKALIIDYKSGNATSLNTIKYAPISNVQLPMYAQLDTARTIGGVYFGLVHETPSLKGLGDVDIRTDAAAEKTMEPAEWDALQDTWRASLTEQTLDFLKGNAEVAPLSNAACRYCHLQTVCRIGQKAQ